MERGRWKETESEGEKEAQTDRHRQEVRAKVR